MGRNKSTNPEKTSETVGYYYNLAKENGLLEDILNVGGFQEQAIKKTIREGRISERMIQAFSRVMGTDPRVLKGELNLQNEPIDDMTITRSDTIAPSDEKTIELIKFLLEANTQANNTQFNKKVIIIKRGIVKLIYENFPVMRGSLEQYMISPKNLGPEMIGVLVQNINNKNSDNK